MFDVSFPPRMDRNYRGEKIRFGGHDYATALALIILQMPHRYLPVFHGKGPGA
jgi:hypothetical protein